MRPESGPESFAAGSLFSVGWSLWPAAPVANHVPVVGWQAHSVPRGWGLTQSSWLAPRSHSREWSWGCGGRGGLGAGLPSLETSVRISPCDPKGKCGWWPPTRPRGLAPAPTLMQDWRGFAWDSRWNRAPLPCPCWRTTRPRPLPYSCCLVCQGISSAREKVDEGGHGGAWLRGLQRCGRPSGWCPNPAIAGQKGQ